jgi:hypothetical protein
VIYPSIGNFTWSKKKYTFRGQKGENKPSETKRWNHGPIHKVMHKHKSSPKRKNYQHDTAMKYADDKATDFFHLIRKSIKKILSDFV